MAVFIFPEKDPGETVVVTFDFVADLVVGETLASAVFHAYLYAGQNQGLEAPTLLSGSPTIVGNQVRQAVTQGVPGFDYDLVCTAITSSGQVFVETARLPIRWTR